MEKEIDILIVGSANIDMVMQVQRLPLPGETLGEGKFSQLTGGKGANQAIAAAKAGGKVAMIASIGKDKLGNQLIEVLNQSYVETMAIHREPASHTGVAMIYVEESGENMITVAPGANYHLSIDYLKKHLFLFSQAQLLLLQLEIPYESVAFCIDWAKEQGIKVMLNTAPARHLPKEILSQVDILVANQVELEILVHQSISGIEEIPEAVNQLHHAGIKTVIITMGNNGCFISQKELSHYIQAFRVQAIDTTAAGDVFCGNLAVSLLEDLPIKKAVRRACAAAAISVTRFGAHSSAPTRSETDTFLKV